MVLIGDPAWVALGEPTGAIWNHARQANACVDWGISRVAPIKFSSEDYKGTQDRKLGEYFEALQAANISDQGLLEHGNYSTESSFLGM